MPPSRQGKRQVIAFLVPEQLAAAQAKARRDELTHQEVIGEALNLVFERHGLPRMVEAGHKRIVRRNNGRARARSGVETPSCRTGRTAFGGWFEESAVARLHRLASEQGMSVQQTVEIGIHLLTGSKAPGPDEAQPADGRRRPGRRTREAAAVEAVAA